MTLLYGYLIYMITIGKWSIVDARLYNLTAGY